MKIRNILFVSAAVLLYTASISATTIEHTWVSWSGSDSNPCTQTSPCLTFAGALLNTTPGGIITARDAGDYGPVTIAQSVTIDGNNLGSITINNGAGIYITAPVNVTVQNLTINGLATLLGLGGHGITAINGGIVSVDNCKIINFVLVGILFEGAGTLTVENSRIESFIGNNIHGIWVYANAAQNVVVRNTFINASSVSNSNSGFYVDSNGGAAKASLQNVAITGAGQYAVWVTSGVTEITGSVLTQSGTGAYATLGATVSVASSLITANTTGVCSDPSSKIRLDNNDIYDNTTAIANCGGIVKTSTTNKTSGTIAIPAADVSDSVTF